jgi:phosphoglucomutase
LTASHNSGGPQNDWGIKFNGTNGGPALEDVTDRIFECTKKIDEYTTTNDFTQMIDLSLLGRYEFTNVKNGKGRFVVDVVSCTDGYVSCMKENFDFPKIHSFLQRKDFSMVFDGLSGVAGPYAIAILENEFGLDRKNLNNCVTLPDFGGLHPDPNLVYADQLVKKMQILSEDETQTVPDFGAACDGDADRNMVLGKKFFVTPSDSVALLAALSHTWIGKKKMTGVARSMPTSGALDQVAQKLGLDLYITPTGWKFFGNLMDSDRILLCGEESFGTGSSHIREKDGLWAILCWLSILADANPDPKNPLVTVESIVNDHWRTYGRNYYMRYDYEAVESKGANEMMAHLEGQFQSFRDECVGNKAEIFEYLDPVDGSVSKNQGVIFTFKDGSRIIFRLSGTGNFFG